MNYIFIDSIILFVIYVKLSTALPIIDVTGYYDPLGVCSHGDSNCFKKDCSNRNNEEFDRCGAHCQLECGEKVKGCDLKCIPGCKCKKGYCRNRNATNPTSNCIFYNKKRRHLSLSVRATKHRLKSTFEQPPENIPIQTTITLQTMPKLIQKIKRKTTPFSSKLPPIKRSGKSQPLSKSIFDPKFKSKHILEPQSTLKLKIKSRKKEHPIFKDIISSKEKSLNDLYTEDKLKIKAISESESASKQNLKSESKQEAQYRSHRKKKCLETYPKFKSDCKSKKYKYYVLMARQPSINYSKRTTKIMFKEKLENKTNTSGVSIIDGKSTTSGINPSKKNSLVTTSTNLTTKRAKTSSEEKLINQISKQPKPTSRTTPTKSKKKSTVKTSQNHTTKRAMTTSSSFEESTNYMSTSTSSNIKVPGADSLPNIDLLDYVTDDSGIWVNMHPKWYTLY